ncbi:MAG TPA: flagellar hook-associated protein FlgK [Devosiaceae bacterium]|jgi:flagellar hook-associated protein 1 FlgK|nr:flagellar hook-associated protein FlgK [Devosiaceae bacterium]
MGLSMALSNALSGMTVGQKGLDLLSRNVANAGVPGYHRQSLTVIDTLGANSSYVRDGAITRAFDERLQHYYTQTLSESGFTAVRTSFLDRLQTAFGMPGQAGSLDTAFSSFQSALDAIATSPDSYAARAQAVSEAQSMAVTLNNLSDEVQTLRLETEGKIASSVSDLNQVLSSLEKLNLSLSDSSIDLNSRTSLLDQRDRLVSEVAQVLDVRVSYRNDGTVALMTRSGVGLLDVRASKLEFEGVGTISATSQFSGDSSENGVGTLKLWTSAGVVIDVVQQNMLRSGELAGLIELRDKTLVEAQDQLDEIAAGLALAMSSVKVPSAEVTVGAAAGFEIDLATLGSRGDDFTLDYIAGGISRSLRVVNTTETVDYTDANGVRVVGADLSDPAASAMALQAVLGGAFTVSNPAGTTLRFVDDGAANTSDVKGLVGRATATATQDGTLALPLFLDNGSPYTGALEGISQKRGFAARIQVNPAVLADSALMVKFRPEGSLGEADRAEFLVEQLQNMRFVAGKKSTSGGASFRLSGTVSDLITQTINYQGSVAAAAQGAHETQTLKMETVTQRMDAEYGVDVDEEMARLMELQNAFAANARVVSIVQELLDMLMRV